MEREQDPGRPQEQNRRRFLKWAALGVASAIDSTARLMGVPGLSSTAESPTGRSTLDQPENPEDPLFSASGPYDDHTNPERPDDEDPQPPDSPSNPGR